MRRRFQVEVVVNDDAPGAALEALFSLNSALEKMQKDKVIEDYGLALEHDATWFVKTAAQVLEKVEKEEERHGEGT